MLATVVLWALHTVCNMYASVTYSMNAGPLAHAVVIKLTMQEDKREGLE
jgi:hypothetical protein